MWGSCPVAGALLQEFHCRPVVGVLVLHTMKLGVLLASAVA